MTTENIGRFKEFISNYNSAISSNINNIEIKRKELLLMQRLFLIVSVIVMILSVAINIKLYNHLYNNSPDLFKNIIHVLNIVEIALGIFLLAHGLHYKKIYHTYIKGKILCNLLKSFGCETTSKISLEEIKKSNVLTDFKYSIIETKYDDTFSGIYNGINFQIAEGRVYYLNNNNKKTYNKYLFCLINLNKNNQDKKTISIAFPYFNISCLLTIIIIFVPLIFFAKIFVILLSFLLYLSFYCCLIPDSIKNIELTKKGNIKLFINNIKQKKTNFKNTNFINKLYSFKKIYKARFISCSLYDDKLMLAIKTNKDLFEIGELNKPISDSNSVYNFYRELNEIYKLIDYLILNNDEINNNYY